ncbi:heavy metal translocating P-type ATPase [Nitratireductor basaltis]|nr:heavy metal translocating P-type ATPase [Nitratireductor basaltis]
MRAELQNEDAHLHIPIEGMSCASCVRRVETAIARVPGVVKASVNLAAEAAEVEIAPTGDRSSVIAAIRSAGYEVPQDSVILEIDGMTCASCVRRVEQALLAVPGVTGASVNLATESASVHTERNVTAKTLQDAVASIGYDARVKDNVRSAAEHGARKKEIEFSRLKRDFLTAAVLTLPLFLLEMGSHFIPGMHGWLGGTFGHALYIFYFVLATIVQFGPGLRFYRKGVPSLIRLTPDMDSLVVLGSTAAWAYSTVAVFAPGVLPAGTANIYFEASAVIITLILMGRLLEARAKGRTGEAIKRLMNLQAKTARVERDGEFIETELDAVVVGDVIRVRPGESIPVDGEILTGSSFVDEAMISGEAAPVSKGEGDEVIGGTINKTGSFTYRATKIGADTVLAQIIKMVETAQGAKLPIQAMVDRVTAWFVPAVMAAALATFLVWLIFGPEPALGFAVVNAVAVLIIACPCAMGLATPTSIMVGTGRAAELGVLFRNGDALQSLRSTGIVALDKTGTITLGRPALTDFEIVAEHDRPRLLSLIASAEAGSEHPVAEAILEAARKEDIPLNQAETFNAIAGFGIEAMIDGQNVNIGADRLMEKLGIDVSPYADVVAKLAGEAKTPLYAAVNGKLAAILAVADPIKPSSPAAIDALHKLGLKVAMVTGDNRHTAKAIASRLGIDEVLSEVLPDGKVDAVKRLREEHGVLAFVGDGINDAPALAEADIGIAIGTGTDIAIESADVVLMSGDLRGVANALGLSQATIKNIRQNLFWAFAYNASLIPVAAGLLYPVTGTLLSPMLAAGAMALSSVFVLGNALRLKRYEAPLAAGERP